jgi:preprotein translocase subunit SecA
MRQLERLVMLRAVDTRWVRHLTDLDELREGIGLRAFAQQDPLIAYKKEAHDMYQDLLATISQDVVNSIYHAGLMIRPALPLQRIQTNRGDGSSAQPVRSAKTLGRNDPCWCGSGKKYKQCHMRTDLGQAPAMASAPGDGRVAQAPVPAKAASRAQAVPASAPKAKPKGRR